MIFILYLALNVEHYCQAWSSDCCLIPRYHHFHHFFGPNYQNLGNSFLSAAITNCLRGSKKLLPRRNSGVRRRRSSVIRNPTTADTARLKGVPKNTFLECCWSHSAMAQLQVAGTPCGRKLIFWSLLTKTKPDQAFQSHVHDKI